MFGEDEAVEEVARVDRQRLTVGEDEEVLAEHGFLHGPETGHPV